MSNLCEFEHNGKTYVALVRKLSERECFRLMGVDDNDIDKLATSGISRTAQYKLAGNSIVVDVLYHIFRKLFVEPNNENVQGDLFAQESEAPKYDKSNPLRVVTLCSGYDSQCLALERVKRDFPPFDYELVAWSEFDPQSKVPIDNQPAVMAHNVFFPQWADRNLGDMTKIDWEKVPDFDMLFYSTPCFVAGTLVMTDKGTVPIEKVKVGDMVLTSDGYRKVTKFFDNGTHKTSKTKINYLVDGKVYQTSFEATTNHKIKTARGWVELKDLMHTDKVYVLDPTDKEGNNIIVESQISTIVKIGNYNHVYDIEVEDMHEFFAEGLLVHNCQSISAAGLQHGFTEGSGTRSSIIWNVRDALKIKKPKYACLENVAAMVSDKFLPMFNLWRSEVEKLGYENYANILNAKHYGVPQNRERIFLVSVRDDIGTYFNWPQKIKLKKTLQETLQNDVDLRNYLNPTKVDKFVQDNLPMIKRFIDEEDSPIEELPDKLREWLENYEDDSCISDEE